MLHLLYYFFSYSGANRNPEMESSSRSARRFRAARGAYARLEERRVTFLKQVNKMLEIVNALPAEVDTLTAKPESSHGQTRTKVGWRRRRERERDARGQHKVS